MITFELVFATFLFIYFSLLGPWLRMTSTPSEKNSRRCNNMTVHNLFKICSRRET